jgi:hypothetical protein
MHSAGHAFANTHRPEYYLAEVAEIAHTQTFALLDQLRYPSGQPQDVSKSRL